MIIIYGKPGCSFCKRAVDYCIQNSIHYSYKNVGSDISVDELRETLNRHVTSVPQIVSVSNGFSDYIGGFDDLLNFFSSSKV